MKKLANVEVLLGKELINKVRAEGMTHKEQEEYLLGTALVDLVCVSSLLKDALTDKEDCILAVREVVKEIFEQLYYLHSEVIRENLLKGGEKIDEEDEDDLDFLN